MRGNNFFKTRCRPVGEIYIDFEKGVGEITLGMKLTPKEVGLAMEDFGQFLQTLPDDTYYANYDEGDMCAGN